jgi:glycosyltransferase involved in cell wall biosynthesis
VGPEADAKSGPMAFRHHIVRMPWRRLEASRFNKLHRTLRCFGLVPQFPVRKVDALLGEFQPEVVLTVMQHAMWYDSAMAYAQTEGLPLVTIVHDTNESFDKVCGWAREAQRGADGRFYRAAKHRLCVSPEMEQFCFRKYGVRGEVMYPNRDESLRPRPLDMNRELRNPPYLTVGFVGNVNYGYGKALVDLLPTFEKSGTRLRIWGQPPGEECRSLLESPLVRWEGFLPSPEVWEPVKDGCDAVILPYSDEERMRQLYSYHFPSKLPEYLRLGMPVIVTGPEYATGYRWGMRNPQAVVTVDHDAEVKIVQTLEKLKFEKEWREKMAQGAIRAALMEFDPEKIRSHFHEILSKAKSF